MLIGFIGAPSCGKSTTAFGLSYLLKKQGYAVEFLPEYARRHISDCRRKGINGNGGYDGQTVIYNKDRESAQYYRKNTDMITISDGCTLNCYFYNSFMHISLAEEAKLYDVLFYIPVTDVVPMVHDANRVQTAAEILAFSHKWEERIRPLMATAPNIIALTGYPHKTQDEMAEDALAYLTEYMSEKKLAA